jgi:hypothetical protein
MATEPQAVGSNTNVYSIVRVPQGRKTAMIIKEIERLSGPQRQVFVVLSDNNIALNDQNSKRYLEGLNKESIRTIRIDSRSGKGFKESDQDALLFRRSTLVLGLCNNYVRIEQINSFLDKSRQKNVPVTVMIDEADRYQKRFANYTDWTDKVDRLYLITATTASCFGHFDAVNLKTERTVYDRRLYRRVEDSSIKLVELRRTKRTDKAFEILPTFLSSVDRETAQLVFVPGPNSSKGSDFLSIAYTSQRHGFSCLVINQAGWNLYSRELDGIVDLKTTRLTVLESIVQLRQDSPELFPLVITGNRCVGRGLTFNDFETGLRLTDSYMLFLPDPRDQGGVDALYQMQRYLGNVKHHEKRSHRLWATEEQYRELLKIERTTIAFVEQHSQDAAGHEGASAFVATGGREWNSTYEKIARQLDFRTYKTPSYEEYQRRMDELEREHPGCQVVKLHSKFRLRRRVDFSEERFWMRDLGLQGHFSALTGRSGTATLFDSPRFHRLFGAPQWRKKGEASQKEVLVVPLYEDESQTAEEVLVYTVELTEFRNGRLYWWGGRHPTNGHYYVFTSGHVCSTERRVGLVDYDEEIEM